jgi:hypothetical protein
VGSIDVDLALDAARLNDGRYADILKSILATGRYRRGDREFQLGAEVDLGDGGATVHVDVDFIAPKEVRLKKHHPRLVEDFRIIKADGCAVAFASPVELPLSGLNLSGVKNTVRLRVVSLPDFLVMKAFAIELRDKPKDCYDLCYCLDQAPGGPEALAVSWRDRKKEVDVARAIAVLKEKFRDVDSYGPRQVVEFYSSGEAEEQAMQARRAYELVRAFLESL